MSKCGLSTVGKYEQYAGIAQLIASQIGKQVAGSAGQAYATFLTGQNSWTARIADLADKYSRGGSKAC
ncbi:hypothetical protein [Neisseria yangbaofengii]|uniref:hypothetical protein n=1 Tax=Neisseria yangbaofengii TaxID=2709396 RepID=UPI0013EB9EAB|nr:hypothetical protein [Neisseria yangbaofengii]